MNYDIDTDFQPNEGCFFSQAYEWPSGGRVYTPPDMPTSPIQAFWLNFLVANYYEPKSWTKSQNATFLRLGHTNFQGSCLSLVNWSPVSLQSLSVTGPLGALEFDLISTKSVYPIIRISKDKKKEGIEFTFQIRNILDLNPKCT